MVSHTLLRLHVPYVATNFPSPAPPALTGSQTLRCTWTDLVWAAVTAGKPGAAHLLAHRWHSLADIVVRTHAIYANLRQRGTHVDRSSLYDAMDPSEKGATSYFLGMAMAKLFASELFDTPWLFHVSLATSEGVAIRFTRGSRSQPDLIGQTSGGDWIVVEAKGRTNGFDGDALGRAKQQTSMIRTINGSPPSLRVALQVYFSDAMSVRIDDPSDNDEEAIDVKLDMDEALVRYYAVAEAVSDGRASRQTIRDREYVTRFDEDSGITIGVEASTLDHVLKRRLSRVQMDRIQAKRGATHLDERSAIYPDGLFIRLDERWSSQFMTREPEARGG